MINLFTSYYQCGDPRRQQEIDACITHNINNASIDRLIVLIDDGSELKTTNPKVHIIHMDRRPTYLDWIEQTKALNLQGVSILCNSDIHFDEKITDFKTCFSDEKTFIALSRWEVLSTGNELHPNPHWSQDVWAIHTDSLGDEDLFKTLNFPMGVPRCDNKIVFQFATYGWKVINPCEFIRSYHLHETGFRTYHKKLDFRLIGGVAYVHPSNSLNEASKLEFDVWVKKSKQIQSLKLNKSLEKWINEAAADNAEKSEIANNLNSKASAVTVHKPFDHCPKNFMTNGTLIFQHAFRFRVYELGDTLMYLDNLSPNDPVFQPINNQDITQFSLSADILENWIAPVVDTFPIKIRQRPIDTEDVQFWQYPCSTEEQAYKNHLIIARGANIDYSKKIANIYLALPWATYIDKKKTPDRIVPMLKSKIAGFADLATQMGYKLKVHTVCQQIHWRRFIPVFNDLGVTDLHISHKEIGVDNTPDIKFKVHSWPLIAVNVETPERAKGLVFDKPIEDKTYLASFIGAHMPHYRSDVRVKLFEAAQDHNAPNILVDLGNEWHFNKIVYQEQVLGKSLSGHDKKAGEDRTVRYNRVISDSVFSLCPEGAGPNTLRVWESMAVGSIPVIFADEWIPPNVPGDTLRFDECALLFKKDEISTVFNRLKNLPDHKIEMLKANGMKAYEKFRNMRAF